MSGFNSERNANYQKKKWETVITFISLALCTAGLATISVISYFQTMYAFKPLNDTEIPVIGGWIAVGMAFIFQYGQNAALYYKAHYTSGSHVFNFLFWNITDRAACNAIFAICALIDAGTNLIWLEGNTEVATMKWYFQVLVYGVMIGVVFVEEVLGKVLQATSHVYTELQKIMAFEQRKGEHKEEPHAPKPQQPQQQQHTQPKKDEHNHHKGGGGQKETQRMSNMPFRDRRQNDEIMSKLPRENHKGRFE